MEADGVPQFDPHSRRPGRRLAFAAGFTMAAALAFTGLGTGPAYAQGISLLRDTETEDMLRSYETPLAKAAGLDPQAIHLYLVGSPEVNAFVAEGQNLFVLSGIILYCKTPNELIGVMAHETGHIAAGHIIRSGVGMEHAMVPMLLSLLLGAAAMAMGAGDAGMVIMGAGSAMAQAQMAAFTRVQESSADQIAVRLLNATHQSPMGIYSTFTRFAIEQAQSAYKIDKYAVDHPVVQERLADIEQKVNASPWRDVKDPPQVMHTFEMVQAKLAGFTLPVQEALDRYPETDTSEPARYARAMVYMRKPDMAKALATISSLIKDEPNNPFFYEVLGQIHVTMAKPLPGSMISRQDISPGTELNSWVISRSLASRGTRATSRGPVKFDRDDPLYVSTLRTTRCDASGSFSFARVPDGIWFATTSVKWGNSQGGGAEGGSMMQRVDVRGGKLVKVTLP